VTGSSSPGGRRPLPLRGSPGPPSPPAKQPTIRDVAEQAGVSKSLVSLVLRGDSHVSEPRRRAVLEAVDALGYRPNLQARGLANARTDVIGVLLNDLRNPWFVDLLEGLTTTLDASGLDPVLVDCRTDLRVGRRSVEALLRRGVDGFVVVGTTPVPDAVAEAAQLAPVVLAGTREPTLPDVDIVVDDDAAGGRLATDHLLALGHTRIAHLRGPGEIGNLRFTGFRSRMEAAGLDADAYADLPGMNEESGYRSARRLLDLPDPPTAIFAFNDLAALGVLSAAADHGFAVPSDLSVVGYDNTYLARIRHLSMTSVDNGNFAVGAQAGRFLIERLEARALPQRLHLVATELRVRGSSGPPPARAERGTRR
jgi:DNA-binding LacI/PurR family transcriptional regulator